MPRIGVLVFDLDGTLVDSRRSVYEAGRHTLEVLGLEKRSFEEIVSCMGEGIEGLVRCVLGGEVKDFDEAMRVFIDHLRGSYARDSELFPNVRQVLEYFEDRRKFVLTNGRMEIARGILEEKGMTRYFEDIFAGDDDTCLKPSPCPVKRMLESSGAEPGQVLLTGDMEHDILAGRDAGVLTCAVTYGVGKREVLEAAGPDYMIDDLGELEAIAG